jgi:hypothetical protein
VIIACDYIRECIADITVTYAWPRASSPLATSPPPLATPASRGEERGVSTPVGLGHRPCAGSIFSAGRAVKAAYRAAKMLPREAASRHEADDREDKTSDSPRLNVMAAGPDLIPPAATLRGQRYGLKREGR